MFDYEYFLNNWGWWWGSTITGQGAQRANWDFDFQGSPTVNGSIYAANQIQENEVTIDFNANLDPVIGDASDNDGVTHDQCPSNRHNYRTDLVFADGHVESPKRNDVINPLDNNWRAKWNNDNDPHLPGTANGIGNWTLSNVSALEQ